MLGKMTKAQMYAYRVVAADLIERWPGDQAKLIAALVERFGTQFSVVPVGGHGSAAQVSMLDLDAIAFRGQAAALGNWATRVRNIHG